MTESLYYINRNTDNLSRKGSIDAARFNERLSKLGTDPYLSVLLSDPRVLDLEPGKELNYNFPDLTGSYNFRYERSATDMVGMWPNNGRPWRVGERFPVLPGELSVDESDREIINLTPSVITRLLVDRLGPPVGFVEAQPIQAHPHQGDYQRVGTNILLKRKARKLAEKAHKAAEKAYGVRPKQIFPWYEVKPGEPITTEAPQQRATVITIRDTSPHLIGIKYDAAQLLNFWLNSYLGSFYEGLENKFITHNEEANIRSGDGFWIDFSNDPKEVTIGTRAMQLAIKAAEEAKSRGLVYVYYFFGGKMLHSDLANCVKAMKDLAGIVDLLGVAEFIDTDPPEHYSKIRDALPIIIPDKMRIQRVIKKNEIWATISAFHSK